MKLKLFFTSFLCVISSIAFSQDSPASTFKDNNKKEELPMYNLYYLSKYIGSENLSNTQINLLYKGLLANLGKEEKALNSIITNDNRYVLVKNFLNEIELKKNIAKEDIDFLLTNGRFDDFKESYKNKYTIKELDTLKKNYHSLLNPEKVKTINDKKEILSKLKNSINNNDINSINELKVELSNLDPNLNPDNLKEAVLKDSQEITKNNEKVDLLKKQIEKIRNEVLSKIKTSDYITSSNSTAYIDSKVVSTEITLNSTIQTSEQRAATNTYKLPSESDMINAMAMFLAKRAQQETAIWFMDKIRENIKNPLVYEAFPQTIKLIESLEDFKTPNFSVAWRYAIASDFVKMPENLANSAWVQNFLFDGDSTKIENFSKAVTFGYDLNRLVAEKYNYRDIIRYFYTNPEYDIFKNDVDQKNEMKVMLKTSISILYILTNELFAIDEVEGKNSYRLLSYEEISGMTEKQWSVLGQLIQLKYGTENGKFDSFFKDEFNQHKQSLSKWVGNLLISLSQFDKVNKDFQNTLEKKENEPNYNFYNVWQNTLQIIDNIDYKKYLGKNNQPNKDYIEILKQSISIYENIQNKNYPEAIQKTLEIIAKVSTIDKKDYNTQSFELTFKKEKLNFSADGQSFTYKKENYVITTDAGGCLVISDHKSFNCRFSKFNKTKYIFPFLTNYKSDNFEMVVAYDREFKTNIDNLQKKLEIDNVELFSLINYLGFRNETGWDNQKLFEFISASSNNIRKNYIVSDKIEITKLKYQDKLLKITAFFGDVLVAKNSEELANVLDSHALPPTSYKLKRRVKRSIDLNGYVGLQGSRMWTNGFTSLKTQYTVGITAPIGFAYTWSSLKRNKPNNWGITIDIVDLGNIVNHYLVNSTDDYTKDVHFSEVFSPAASFMYALRKTPFVVFASFKLLPLKTSSITEGTTKILINEKAFDATVFSVGLKIDIPLVNLWSTVD